MVAGIAADRARLRKRTCGFWASLPVFKDYANFHPSSLLSPFKVGGSLVHIECTSSLPHIEMIERHELYPSCGWHPPVSLLFRATDKAYCREIERAREPHVMHLQCRGCLLDLKLYICARISPSDASISRSILGTLSSFPWSL